MNDKTRYSVQNVDGSQEHHTNDAVLAFHIAKTYADLNGSAHIIDRTFDDHGNVKDARGYVLKANT